jgi:predicted CoA-binding protein
MSSDSTVTNPSDDTVREILAGMRRVAVVGLSANPERASHGISKFLSGQGLEVYGVNPVLKEDVLGGGNSG